MKTIKKLIELGRDPLEVLFVPLAPDVAEWLKEEDNQRVDEKIRDEISTWTPAMHARLRELMEQAKNK